MTTKALLAPLREEEARLQAELEVASANERTLRLALKRIQQALAALGGEASKGSLTDSSVREFVLQHLAKGASTKAALQEALQVYAKSMGHSGLGLHLALARILKDDRFEKSGDSIAVTRQRAS